MADQITYFPSGRAEVYIRCDSDDVFVPFVRVERGHRYGHASFRVYLFVFHGHNALFLLEAGPPRFDVVSR